MSDRGFHQRLKLASILLLLIPLGLLVKFGISGPLENWCNRYGAAILYEIFWIFVVRLFLLNLRAIVCALVVFAATCLLEVLQLWHPAWLEAIRATFLGAAVFGTTFDSADFFYYAIGSMLGIALLKMTAENKN